MVIMTGFDVGSESYPLTLPYNMFNGSQECRSRSQVKLTIDFFQAIIYLAIATFFMHTWAGQKFARYKKEFDPKVFPGRRWKWFPPLS